VARELLIYLLHRTKRPEQFPSRVERFQCEALAGFSQPGTVSLMMAFVSRVLTTLQADTLLYLFGNPELRKLLKVTDQEILDI